MSRRPQPSQKTEPTSPGTQNNGPTHNHVSVVGWQPDDQGIWDAGGE